MTGLRKRGREETDEEELRRQVQKMLDAAFETQNGDLLFGQFAVRTHPLTHDFEQYMTDRGFGQLLPYMRLEVAHTVRSIHNNLGELGTLREGSGITDKFSEQFKAELSAFDTARQRLRRLCINELIDAIVARAFTE